MIGRTLIAGHRQSWAGAKRWPVAENLCAPALGRGGLLLRLRRSFKTSLIARACLCGDQLIDFYLPGEKPIFVLISRNPRPAKVGGFLF